jgi:anthranilate phosphoribosyltransferase
MRFSASKVLYKSTNFAKMSEAKAAVSISPLLLRLADPTTTLYSVTADEVALAVSHIFANAISPVQTGCLLYALHTTQLDRRPDILAACASSMRSAAAQVDHDALAKAVSQRARKEGQYHGGLVWYAQATLLLLPFTYSSTV